MCSINRIKLFEKIVEDRVREEKAKFEKMMDDLTKAQINYINFFKLNLDK